MRRYSSSSSSGSHRPPAANSSLRELVEYVARALVDSPEDVRVEEDWSGNHAVFHLFVAEEDMGKVIGKQGRIAQALRSLLKVSAMKHDIRAILEIGQ